MKHNEIIENINNNEIIKDIQNGDGVSLIFKVYEYFDNEFILEKIEEYNKENNTELDIKDIESFGYKDPNLFLNFKDATIEIDKGEHDCYCDDIDYEKAIGLVTV